MCGGWPPSISRWPDACGNGASPLRCVGSSDGRHVCSASGSAARCATFCGSLLTDLLAETPDAELVRLHDKHADVSFDEERQQDMEVMRALAREAFGIDVEAYEGGESPEELAEWLDQQRQASRPEEPSESRTRKKSAKAIEREALQAQMAEGGNPCGARGVSETRQRTPPRPRDRPR